MFVRKEIQKWRIFNGINRGPGYTRFPDASSGFGRGPLPVSRLTCLLFPQGTEPPNWFSEGECYTLPEILQKKNAALAKVMPVSF